MESVYLRLYSDAYPCHDTCRHPNINIKTQIPLELGFFIAVNALTVLALVQIGLSLTLRAREVNLDYVGFCATTGG